MWFRNYLKHVNVTSRLKYIEGLDQCHLKVKTLIQDHRHNHFEDKAKVNNKAALKSKLIPDHLENKAI